MKTWNAALRNWQRSWRPSKGGIRRPTPGAREHFSKCLLLIIAALEIRATIIVLCTWWLARMPTEARSRGTAEVGPMEDLVEELPDGILVTGGDDTRNHVATWTVLVTMTPHEKTRHCSRNYANSATLRKHHELYALSNITRNIWEQRIRELETTMVIATPGDVRVRRGLFNIIGEI